MKHCVRLGALATWVPWAQRLAQLVSVLALTTQFSSPAQAAAPPPWEGAAFSAKPAALLAAIKDLPTDEAWETDILLSDSRFSLEADGRWTERHHRIYVVLDAAEVDAWAVFEQVWSPWFQARPEMRARVISPAGREFSFDPKTISEESAGQSSDVLFDDDRVLRGPLPGVEVGAIIETEVVVRDQRPMFVGGSVRRLALFEDHIRLARISVDAAPEAGLRWLTKKLPETPPQESTEKGRKRLVFEYRDLKGTINYIYGLPTSEPWYPYLAFSSGQSWNDVAKAYADVVDRTLEGADVARAVSIATKGAKAQTEVIERLLAYLQKEVRYTGVEFGDASLIPRSPAETLARRFGDCKDKSALLVALLRAADIPAYLALLSVGPGQDVDTDLPGLGVFDHAIVYIPASPPIWIDATDEFARVGELPAVDRDRLALIAAGSTRALVRTPPSVSTENLIRRTRTFHLAEAGSARLIEETEFRGQPERDNRRTFGLFDQTKRMEWAKTYAENYLLAAEVDKVEVLGAGDLNRPFVLRLEIGASRRGISDLNEAAIGIRYDELLERLPYLLRVEADENEEPRKEPFVFDEPFVTEWHYEVHPPPGFEPRGLPESRDESIGTASLSRRYRVRPDGVLEIDFRFDSGKVRLTPTEFEAYRRQASALLEGESLLIYFDQIGAQKLAEGDVLGALTEFRRLAAANPKNAIYPLQMSRALLEAGLGEAARERARAAVKLDPKSSLAHNQLGWALQHDLFGRLRQGDFDRNGAIAAYREAVRLDSEEVVPKADLAILLEFDARGRRYARGLEVAELEEAGKLYRELVDQGQTGFAVNLMANLARRERYAELRTFAASLEESLEQLQFRTVAVAALEGAEAAIRGTRGLNDRSQRAQALGGAAQTLLQMRRYREGKALLEASLSFATEKPTKVPELLAKLDTVKKWEEIPTPAREPATLLAHMTLGLLRGEIGVKQADGYLSRKMSAETRIDEVADFERDPFETISDHDKSNGLSPDFLFDLFLNIWTPKVDGDDAMGYRVSFEVEGQRTTYYVVREDGEYRLLATEENLLDLAILALDLLASGDTAAASRWIGWLEDERQHALPKFRERDDDPYANSLEKLLWGVTADADASALGEAAAAQVLNLVNFPLSPTELRASERALAKFVERRATAEGDHATALDVAQWRLLEQLGRSAELVGLLEKLHRAEPSSDQALISLTRVYGDLKRFDDAEKIATARAETKVGDPISIRLLADLDDRRGDVEASSRRIASLLEGKDARPHDYNRLAWNSLFASGGVDDTAIGRAEKACELTSYANPNILHTLATLYAERVRVVEAHRTLLKALELHKDGKLERHDWYVFARIAEALGYPDLARDYYRKVEPNETREVGVQSTQELARQRLVALGAGPNGTSKGKKKKG